MNASAPYPEALLLLPVVVVNRACPHPEAVLFMAGREAAEGVRSHRGVFDFESLLNHVRRLLRSRSRPSQLAAMVKTKGPIESFHRGYDLLVFVFDLLC